MVAFAHPMPNNKTGNTNRLLILGIKSHSTVQRTIWKTGFVFHYEVLSTSVTPRPQRKVAVLYPLYVLCRKAGEFKTTVTFWLNRTCLCVGQCRTSPLCELVTASDNQTNLVMGHLSSVLSISLSNFYNVVKQCDN